MGDAIVGRDFRSGRTIRVRFDSTGILEVEPREEPASDWLAPAFWDIQTNGRWGISFSDPTITLDRATAIVRAQASLGTSRICPTLITSPQRDMLHGLATLARACDQDAVVNRMVVGLHLEGPWISRLDGYRGAHPLDAVRIPDWDEFDAWREASGDRIRIVTLAPEVPGAIRMIERLADAGVVVALGHTAADGPTIRDAVAAGARLSTHLGNGLASPLPRHPNPIWTQAAEDGLSASMIADGHHLGTEILRVLARAKGPDRTILVSDASWLAGLPPGVYGEWAVEPSGRIVVSGTPYLAGAGAALDVGLTVLLAATGWSLAEAVATCTMNPARLLGEPEPAIEPGRPAGLVRFRMDGGRIRIVETVVDGRRHSAGEGDAPTDWSPP